MNIHFSKFQGTGNDFIIIDNRNAEIALTTLQIQQLCDRKFGIGADGLMLLERHPDFDFKMVYFNADGRESSMCGNGGRCIVQFAHKLEIIEKNTRFLAIDGEHLATVLGENVRLKMIDVQPPQTTDEGWVLNTGSPHIVCPVADTAAVDVPKSGAAIRYSALFKEEGVNVNFVQQITKNELNARTYERGVENETLSCGTGVTAVAIAHAYENKLPAGKVSINTLGGALSVSFQQDDLGIYKEVYLEGPATFVFEGIITI